MIWSGIRLPINGKKGLPLQVCLSSELSGILLLIIKGDKGAGKFSMVIPKKATTWKPLPPKYVHVTFDTLFSKTNLIEIQILHLPNQVPPVLPIYWI